MTDNLTSDDLITHLHTLHYYVKQGVATAAELAGKIEHCIDQKELLRFLRLREEVLSATERHVCAEIEVQLDRISKHGQEEQDNA